MKRSTLSSMAAFGAAGLIALGLGACGQKADAPPAAPPAPAEPAPAEPTPAEPAPAEPTPAEPAAAEPTPAEPAPAEPGLPGLWAPLFVKGHTLTFLVKEDREAQDLTSDDLDAPWIKESHEGKLTCEVTSVEVEAGTHTAQVACSGYEFKTYELMPAGTWITDGAAVWTPGTGDHGPELRLEASPKAGATKVVENDDGDAEIEREITGGDEPGTWCHTMKYLMGDGALATHCFSEARGLVKLSSAGGAAAESVVVTLTLAP